MIRRHPLDVGPPEPDWGQRNDDPRDPDTVVTFRVTEPVDPEPDPEPEPDWDRLRGDGVHVWQGPLEEVPAPLPHVRHNAPSRGKKVIQDPLPSEMPGGLIRRSRERMGSHRGDLEAQEMRAWLLEPDWVRLTKRRNNAHWLWR
jgi:hypothetical protein